MSCSCTAGEFEPCLIGARFRIEHLGHIYEDVELVEVRRLPCSGGPGRSEPFSLLFRARVLPKSQGLMQLCHPELGAHEVFLVPVRVPGSAETFLEAVFQ